MSRCVVDTNVPIVANGRPDPEGSRAPSISCRIATVTFLQAVLKEGIILLDAAGEIQSEYRRYLSPSGQPGVGDRFYQEVLQSVPERVERVELLHREDGEYADLPQSLIDAGFDRSDRKFAALAKRVDAPVYNATDSDWIEHAGTLAVEQIEVTHLCGCDPARWFT